MLTKTRRRKKPIAETPALQDKGIQVATTTQIEIQLAKATVMDAMVTAAGAVRDTDFLATVGSHALAKYYSLDPVDDKDEREAILAGLQQYFAAYHSTTYASVRPQFRKWVIQALDDTHYSSERPSSEFDEVTVVV